MRIISGKHKGRKIELLKEAGSDIRPTSEFAREAIFNILNHGKFSDDDDADSGNIAGKEVLDAFCGTGAFGLEALSRGAKSVTFIDQNRASIATTRHNAEKMHESENVVFIQADACKLGKARKQYNLIFLDPPYAKGLSLQALTYLDQSSFLAEHGLLIAEDRSEIELPDTFSTFTLADKRKYGETGFWFYKYR